MKREFSSGGVVFKKLRVESGELRIFWLVTKSRPSEPYPKEVWRLPKGWLDDKDNGPGLLARGERKAKEEELQKAALREVREEAGIDAKIIDKIGTERYFSTVSAEKILKFVTFYLMEWKSNLPEGPGWETENVDWLLFEIARKKLSYPGEKKVLDKASIILEQGIQTSLV